MKIKATITTTEEVEKEIKLPYYCEDEARIAVILDEDTIVIVRKIKESPLFIDIGKSDPSYLNSFIARSTESTREKFDTAFETAVNKIKALIIPPFKS